MTSKTGFLCVFLLLLLLVSMAQGNDQASCAHTTGCGCTTTTTCLSQPGKGDTVGPTGIKGDKGENDQEELAEIRRKVLKLEEKVEKLQASSSKFRPRYATACSDYHDDEATENLEHASISYWKSGHQALTIANCTKLGVVRSIAGYPFDIEVPTNSMIARKLIIEGTPVRPHTFSVNFLAESPERYIFHMAARTQARQLIRNDNSDTSESGWNAEERTSGIAYPFQFGVPFRMKIETDDIGFHVKLDGKKLFTFKHRQRPISAISRIRIIGNLNVTFLSFN